jgi:transcriptional regulator with XRE-family HTH domain
VEYTLLIRKYRIEKGMTQAELARKSRVRQSYISQLESAPNAKSPTLRVLFQIAEALQVCPYMLIQSNLPCSDNRMINYEQNYFSSIYTSKRNTVYTSNTSPCKICSWGDFMAGEKFTIYMDEQLKKELKKAAIDESRSASEIITDLVKGYLKRKKELNIKK